MPVCLGYFRREFRSRITESGLFLFCFCVLATGSKAATFSPAGGNYNAAQTVRISTSTAGATIRYSLDGSTPTESIQTVCTLVGIGSSKTLKAIAYKSGMTDRPVSSANYTIGPEVVSPPSMPSRPSMHMVSQSATFCTGGSASTYNNPVQYLFNWGNNTSSVWLAKGDHLCCARLVDYGRVLDNCPSALGPEPLRPFRRVAHIECERNVRELLHLEEPVCCG